MTSDMTGNARRAARRRIAAACVTVVAVASAVVLVVVFAAGQSRLRSGAPLEPTGLPAATDSSTGKAAGGPPNGSRSDAVMPPDLAWSEVAGIAVPVSRRCGPHDSRAGLARGFTHDSAGAVLAAVHIVVRVNPLVGPRVFEPTLRTQVVGPDAPLLRARVAQAYRELPNRPGDDAARQPARLFGYRIVSYRDDVAVLRLLTGAAGVPGQVDDTRQVDATGQTDGPGPRLRASTEVWTSWTGSDWALIAPPGGSFDSVVAAVTDAEAARFLPFSAGR